MLGAMRRRRIRTRIARIGVLVATLGTWTLARTATAAQPCPDGAGALKTVGATPRYVVAVDGTVAIDPKGTAQTFRVQTRGQVQLTRVQGGTRRPLACGVAEPNETYQFVSESGAPTDVDEWSVVELDLYGALPKDPDAELEGRLKQITTAYKKTVATAREKAERDEATVKFAREDLRFRLLSAFDETPANDLRNIESARGADAARRVATAAETTDNLVDDICKPGAHHAFAASRCEVAKEVQATLRTAKASLEAGRTVGAAAGQSLRPGTAPKAPEGFDLCRLDRQIQATREPTPRGHLVHAELPVAANVHTVGYASGRTEGPALKKDAPTAILVERVPNDRTLVIQTVLTDTRETSLGDLLRIFVPVVIKAIGSGVASAEKVLPCTTQVEPPPDLVAPIGTRAFIVPPSSTASADVSICEGKECSAAGPVPSVRNKITFPAPDHARTMLALDFGVNGGTTIDGDNAFGEPVYESAVGNDTLTQSFTLRNRVDVRRHVMFSLLIGRRWNDVMLAFGPGLIDFKGQPAVNQWNFRFGQRIAKDLFATIGLGFRFAERPRDSVPDVVVKSRTPEAEAATPSLATTTEFAVTAGIGLALDLALLGDAGKDIVESLGGKAKQ